MGCCGWEVVFAWDGDSSCPSSLEILWLCGWLSSEAGSTVLSSCEGGSSLACDYNCIPRGSGSSWKYCWLLKLVAVDCRGGRDGGNSLRSGVDIS